MRRRLLLAGALLALSLSATAQEKNSRAHMEACVRWSLVDGQYLTLNSCDTAIAIQMMTLPEGSLVEKNVMPGGTFESGPVPRGPGIEMMFTACPIGYRPSVRVAPQNLGPISESLYNCLPLEKPGA